MHVVWFGFLFAAKRPFLPRKTSQKNRKLPYQIGAKPGSIAESGSVRYSRVMLRIKRPLYEQMINHLEAVYPLEGCGILAGREGKVTAVYPIANILQSPTAFEMDPAAQIQTMLALEEAGDDFLAVFHSHPQGPAVPSPTDIAQAYYPEQLQLIVSFQERHHPTCRTFTIQAGVVREVGIQIE